MRKIIVSRKQYFVINTIFHLFIELLNIILKFVLTKLCCVYFSTRLTQLVESQLRSKKSRRCILHSLDSSRVRAPWKEVWDVMRPQCREEVLLIDVGSLMTTLEGYLQKHRYFGNLFI